MFLDTSIYTCKCATPISRFMAICGDARSVLTGWLRDCNVPSGYIYPYRRSPRIHACVICVLHAYMICRTIAPLYVSSICACTCREYVTRVSYGMMWGMLDVTQAKLPVCPNSGIVSRRFTANGGKTDVDSINFSFARLGQKVIDASFSATLSRYFYILPITKFVMSDKVTCIDIKSIIIHYCLLF